MITRDYHNFTLENALRDVESVIASVRIKRKTEDAQFIVGHGVIRTALIHRLLDYGFEPGEQYGNAGVIVCTIE